MLITFSGLDGSGKTTLIDDLAEVLESRGHSVVVLTMYDNIGFYSYIRRSRDSLKTFWARIKGMGRKPKRALSTNKNLGLVRGDPCTDVSDKSGAAERLFYRIVRSRMARRVTLLCDLVSLWAHRLIEEGWRHNILITDRYIYDSLADVSDRRQTHWLYVRLFLFLAPTPDAPIFVDVPADVAFERKGEYPVDYMTWRRKAYQTIFGWVHRPVVIVNDDLTVSLETLRRIVFERMEERCGKV